MRFLNLKDRGLILANSKFYFSIIIFTCSFSLLHLCFIELLFADFSPVFANGGFVINVHVLYCRDSIYVILSQERWLKFLSTMAED